LAFPPLARGFDWRPAGVAGAAISFDPAAREMTVSLSGKQPESCDLVQHYVVLEPGANHRFRFQSETHGLPAGAGLTWSFIDAKSGAELAAFDISAQPGEFTVPPGCELARLVLRYRRPAGSVRAEGSIAFRDFTLERAG
jgi:hypothetical protein